MMKDKLLKNKIANWFYFSSPGANENKICSDYYETFEGESSDNVSLADLGFKPIGRGAVQRSSFPNNCESVDSSMS